MLDRLCLKKRYIMTIGIVIATAPLICLVMFIEFRFMHDLEQTAISQRETYAVAATQILNERLEAEIAFGKSFITRQSLQQAITAGNRAAIETHLKNMHDISRSMERVYVAAADGTMLAAYPVDATIIGQDFSHRDWYRQTTRTKQPYVSDFFLRAVQPQRYIFTLSMPITAPSGENVGILVMEPKDAFVLTSLDGIKTGGSGSIYVVDKKGALVFHQQFAVDRLIDYATVPVVRKVIQGQSGAEKSFNPLTDQEEVAAYHPIDRSGWGVVTVQPLSEILAPLRRVEKGLYLFIGIILLLAGYNAYKWAFMLLASRRNTEEIAAVNELLQRQSNELQAQAEELEMQTEELQSQNEELQTQGEELEMQTEELLLKNDELEAMQQQLALANEGLELKVQERTAALSAEIDQHRKTEQERRENEEEKILLGQQLRQSQKMEAIGQLAGGVAHDFNNLLTVIDGYGSMMRQDMAHDDPLKVHLDHILAASDKAANLTRSLLAFSRKQVMNPLPEDLNTIVGHFVTFLHRLLGEDIQLSTIIKVDPLPVVVDSVQIEQVLMNLATNARDAMPKGGVLTIETDLQQLDEAYVKLHGYVTPPGLYAIIMVTDNGCGMNEVTQKKIFDPFFTTKEVGKGTGLGLSMAYGIIKQHNGLVHVYSEQGKGTTLKIYLPAMTDQTVYERIVVAQSPLTGGTETVLLAEDDPMVRCLMEQILKDYGYRVILAVDGLDAVMKFAAHQDEIDLVLMDVIMPKKNGKDAVDEIRLLKPGVKVIFSSGYTADFIHNQVGFTEETELIMKPVKPRELIRKVEDVLGRAAL